VVLIVKKHRLAEFEGGRGSAFFCDSEMHTKEIDIDLQHTLDDITSGLIGIRHGHAYKILNSTNDSALSMAKNGAPSGTLVIASQQEKGRGRLQRSWHMSEGDIALSLIVRPPHVPKNWALLPLMPSLAVVEALDELSIKARLKWPNDILIESDEGVLPYFLHFRKVGGILVENLFVNHELSASVIGIGLNLNPDPALIEQVKHAGFLKDIKPNLDRESCLRGLLTHLDQMFVSLDQVRESQLFLRYASACETLGRRVSAVIDNEPIEGIAESINQDGSLVLRAHSRTYNIFAGDVALLI
jgi:BirA family biotin operon repressor/biotin-[acetyl-CoA-carboxylase] ligase